MCIKESKVNWIYTYICKVHLYTIHIHHACIWHIDFFHFSTWLYFSLDGPIPPINIMAEPISPEAISVSWDFPVETGPPPEIGGRRPDIYYTVRVSNPDVG